MRGACFSSDLTPPGTAYGHSDALSHLQTAEPDPGLPHACGTMPCPPVWAAHSPREGRVRPQRGSAWTTARLCAALRGFAQNRCAAQVRAGVCRTRAAAQRRGSALANHRRARREDERSGAGRVRHQVVAGHGYLLRLVRVADHEEPGALVAPPDELDADTGAVTPGASSRSRTSAASCSSSGR